MASFLVVDDDHITVLGLTSLLRSDGHHVSPFTSGSEAIRALATNSFDAVITDLDMPETDGHVIVAAARAQIPQACIVVATARAREASGELLARGACLVADKPLDYDAVHSAVSACRARGGLTRQGECPMEADLARLGFRKR